VLAKLAMEYRALQAIANGNERKLFKDPKMAD